MWIEYALKSNVQNIQRNTALWHIYNKTQNCPIDLFCSLLAVMADVSKADATRSKYTPISDFFSFGLANSQNLKFCSFTYHSYRTGLNAEDGFPMKIRVNYQLSQSPFWKKNTSLSIIVYLQFLDPMNYVRLQGQYKNCQVVIFEKPNTYGQIEINWLWRL